jgi:sulfide:quinone oxidoreductase
MAPLHVLIAGGGVAGLEAALALCDLAGERVEVELLAPGPDFVNRPVTVRNPFASLVTPRVPLDRLGDLGIAVRADGLAEVHASRHQVRTQDGAILGYDRLIVAVGAHAVQSVPGATHFAGPRDAGTIEHLLRGAGADPDRALTFALPDTVTWPLPFYELALLSAGSLAQRGQAPRILLFTHEQRPLELFGPHAGDACARLLHKAGIEVSLATAPQGVFDGALLLGSGSLVPAGDVIAVPAWKGRPVTGLEGDRDGFLHVDAHARVPGAEDVFAAGDITDGAVKQGGLAAQQADAAALRIAAEAGAPVDAEPPRPVLRATMFTADGRLHLRAALGDPEHGEVSATPLWHPTGKLAGRYLAGFLATGNPADPLVDRAVAGSAVS